MSGLPGRLLAGAEGEETWAWAARLLAVLGGAGLPACSSSYGEYDLEDAFMQVTKGRVA